MKTIKLFFFATLISSLFIFSSCLDNQIPEATDEILLSQIENEINTTSIGEEAIINAESFVNAFILKSSSNVNGMQKVVAQFPIVTQISEGNNFPRVYEINYGEEYYDAKNNIYKGIIIFTKFSYKESEYRFNEFYINNDLIEGYKKGDALVKGVLNFISDIKMTNIVTKKSTDRYTIRKRTVIDNNNTDDVYTDDSFSFTGYSIGTALVKGEIFEYNFQIEKPLVSISGLKYYVSGLTQLSVGISTRSTDYGNGELDNKAICTVNNGNPKEIILNW